MTDNASTDGFPAKIEAIDPRTFYAHYDDNADLWIIVRKVQTGSGGIVSDDSYKTAIEAIKAHGIYNMIFYEALVSAYEGAPDNFKEGIVVGKQVRSATSLGGSIIWSEAVKDWLDNVVKFTPAE